ncbi:MAG: hypothetical protein J5906_01045, partial [Acidaminococcaceae bacterium]|nr:hypothetical protein [Acidaminococcaceae bacterium]
MYTITAKSKLATGGGTMTIRLNGNNYTVSYGGQDFSGYRHRSFNYDPVTGRAMVVYYEPAKTYYDSAGKEAVTSLNGGDESAELYFSGSGGNITLTGTDGFFKLTGRKIRSIAANPGAPAAPAAQNQKKTDSAKSGAGQQNKSNFAKSNAGQQKKNGSQKSGAKQQKDAGKKSDYNDRARQQEAEHDDRDDLPETDAGKAAAALGTGLGGA